MLPDVADLRTRWRPTSRAGRFLHFPLVRLVLGVLLQVPGAVVEQVPFGGGLALHVVRGLVALALFVAGYVAYVRLLERRPIVELSRPRAGREFLAGAGLGASLLLLTVAGLALAGDLRVTGIDRPVALLSGLTISASHALFEEILFRALLFKLCEERLGTAAAIAIQAIVFGAMHLPNRDATFIGAASIAIEAGILLAAAFLLTRRLWLAWGIHFAWNYVQAEVFSGSVSGSGASHGALLCDVSGPAWLTGGKFGLEASPIAVGLCLAAGLFLLAKARGRMVTLRAARSMT